MWIDLAVADASYAADHRRSTTTGEPQKFEYLICGLGPTADRKFTAYWQARSQICTLVGIFRRNAHATSWVVELVARHESRQKCLSFAHLRVGVWAVDWHRHPWLVGWSARSTSIANHAVTRETWWRQLTTRIYLLLSAHACEKFNSADLGERQRASAETTVRAATICYHWAGNTHRRRTKYKEPADEGLGCSVRVRVGWRRMI